MAVCYPMPIRHLSGHLSVDNCWAIAQPLLGHCSATIRPLAAAIRLLFHQLQKDMRGDKKFREYESEEEVIADGEESIDGSHRSIETLKIMGSKLKHK